MTTHVNAAKVPPKLYPVIDEMLNNGHSQDSVRQWLAQEHGIETSRSAMSRIAIKLRTEKANAAQAAYVHEIARTAGSDLEVLSENVAILREIRDYARKHMQPTNTIRACAELKNHVALKMGIAGVSSRDPSFEETRDELIELVLKGTDEVKGKSN